MTKDEWMRKAGGGNDRSYAVLAEMVQAFERGEDPVKWRAYRTTLQDLVWERTSRDYRRGGTGSALRCVMVIHPYDGRADAVPLRKIPSVRLRAMAGIGPFALKNDGKLHAKIVTGSTSAPKAKKGRKR